ncbi:hypothetical protein EDB87DRAFT_465520 [Lactarius vividus]|nr:hypothetical protein EDB87DRAFT_465520 [Lactarius vividus]
MYLPLCARNPNTNTDHGLASLLDMHIRESTITGLHHNPPQRHTMAPGTGSLSRLSFCLRRCRTQHVPAYALRWHLRRLHKHGPRAWKCPPASPHLLVQKGLQTKFMGISMPSRPKAMPLGSWIYFDTTVSCAIEIFGAEIFTCCARWKREECRSYLISISASVQDHLQLGHPTIMCVICPILRIAPQNVLASSAASHPRTRSGSRSSFHLGKSCPLKA